MKRTFDELNKSDAAIVTPSKCRLASAEGAPIDDNAEFTGIENADAEIEFNDFDEIKGQKATSNNDRMHPRNKYKNNKPDFKLLADKYAYLAPFLLRLSNGGYSLDFKNPASNRALTKALLDHDFGVKIDLPENQLCPTVTSRVNYILWIEDLLNFNGKSSNKTSVRGIDIGTGASCIYPLLGHAMNQWQFLAIDIDPVSVDFAKRNVASNHWEDSIQIKLSEKGKMFKFVVPEKESFDFTMCNPPFFETVEQKVPNPKAALEITAGELATDGGEYNFILQMILESFDMKEQVRWFTSLIGRKVTLKKLLITFKDLKITNVHQTTLYQGNTTRWAIAWSFSNEGLEVKARDALLKSYAGRTEIMFSSKMVDSNALIARLEPLFRSLEIKFQKDANDLAFTCKVYDNSAVYKACKAAKEGAPIEQSSASFSMFGSGPFIPPKQILGFAIKLVRLSHGQPWSVQCHHSSGDVDFFATACVELKQRLKEK